MNSLMNMGWVGITCGAAVLWGLQYAMWGQLLKVMGPFAALWWYCLLSLIFYSLFVGFKGISLEPAKLMDGQIVALVLAIGVIGFLANVGMVTGFQAANPTLVTMIVASSPLFTAIFAFVLFKEVQVNATALVGFGFIMAGIGLVAWSKQG